MKVAGFNIKCLYGNSNQKTADGYSIISPPVDSNLDFKKILSYSMFSYHASWVTEDGHAYGIGDNIDKQISDSFPKQFIKEPTEVKIHDKDGKEYIPISSVCGRFYSLYIVKSPDDDQLHLAYIHSQNNGVPIFVNINGQNPVAIYGGMTNSAAITEEGSIVMLNKSIVESKNEITKVYTLPDEEKPIYIACLDDYYFVLSQSGKIYQFCLLSYSLSKSFKIVKEIHKRNFAYLTGSFKHAFAVTDTGRVYGFGSNDHGKLGLGREQWGTDRFKRIKILKDYKIKNAYAGSFHSLFKTEDDSIIGFGWNRYGELFLDINPNDDSVYEPTAAAIDGKATYCTVGDSSTAIFVDCEVPYNSPNQILRDPPFKMPIIPVPEPLEQFSAPPSEEVSTPQSEQQSENSTEQISDQQSNQSSLQTSDQISGRSLDNSSKIPSEERFAQLLEPASAEILPDNQTTPNSDHHSEQNSENSNEKSLEQYPVQLSEQNSEKSTEKIIDQKDEPSSEKTEEILPEQSTINEKPELDKVVSIHQPQNTTTNDLVDNSISQINQTEILNTNSKKKTLNIGIAIVILSALIFFIYRMMKK